MNPWLLPLESGGDGGYTPPSVNDFIFDTPVIPGTPHLDEQALLAGRHSGSVGGPALVAGLTPPQGAAPPNGSSSLNTSTNSSEMA